jgi:hypothetical protein
MELVVFSQDLLVALDQVPIHLAQRFQIRREDCLEINQSETRIACGSRVC